jgi:hypothetical protein
MLYVAALIYVLLTASVAAFTVEIRNMPSPWLDRFCNSCRGCSGCATGGVLGRAPNGANRNRCIVYLRDDISGGWRDWVIRHEIDHCRYGARHGH